MQTMARDAGRTARVNGARGALRAEFTVELEEPVGEQRIEHVALVVAAGRHAYVTVAVSTVGEPAPGEIDAILESLRVLEV
jgi:hypothetical protein